MALRDKLLKLWGTFLLTYNDSPMVRQFYAGLRLEAGGQKRGIGNRGGGKRGKMGQVIILIDN